MIVALDEIPRASDPCDPSLDWRPVRHHLGIRAFGVNAFLGAQPGDRVVERHEETGGHEELYVVVRGAARFVLDGTEHDVPAGSVVHVAPGTPREAFATQPDTAVLVVGAARDEPFEVSEWEMRQLKASGARILNNFIARAQHHPTPPEQPDIANRDSVDTNIRAQLRRDAADSRACAQTAAPSQPPTRTYAKARARHPQDASHAARARSRSAAADRPPAQRFSRGSARRP